MTLFVDTVLHEPHVRPGTMLPGCVHLRAGIRPADIEHVTLVVEASDGVTVIRHRVATGVQVRAGRSRSIPFLLPLPWETPVTRIGDRSLGPTSVGLRTLVAGDAGAGAEKEDPEPDPMAVHPLPGHRRVLDAVRRLGYRLESTGFGHRSLPGVRRSLPFFQEFRFRPGPRHAGPSTGLRVAVVANPVGVDAVVETEGPDGALEQAHFTVRHTDGPPAPDR
ncbi:hypothetical protein GCM10010399_65280 [Dactylosporangium fulvum]|uniref:Sporulation protein n=1 Tax=Dactylosporangium fulvum TaxID=53359 RepID=A0ABY5VNJ5_9ACTN|nr:sporulation protein [Dactylosporangium fulvum]UWP78855.1 sporulation protein [Dactylosporangium fulvum]